MTSYELPAESGGDDDEEGEDDHVDENDHFDPKQPTPLDLSENVIRKKRHTD